MRRPLALLALAGLLLALAAVPAPAHESEPSQPGPLNRLFGQPDLSAQRGDGDVTARAAQAAPPPTPRATCGPGSDPEPGMQGRNAADAPGRADGFRCNTTLVGRYDSGGG